MNKKEVGMSMNKKEKRGLTGTTQRILMLILGGICSAVILTFAVLTIIAASKGEYENAPKYLLWVFIAMGLSGLVTFIRDRTKINLVRCIILLAFNITLGVLVLFAKDNKYLFSLVGGLYCLAFILSRVLLIIQKRTLRATILNVILIVLAALLAVGLFIPVKEERVGTVILIECLFIAITALALVAGVAFGQFKFKILFKIVVNTFALEVLFGLVAIMVASALVLMSVEETITNFGDALWYCFATVTTIGFGDFTATTLIGRLITVLLGVYGIVAVAVITSIIVNFYNETSGKKDAKEIKQIQREEKE